ncbi:MAG TPA: peptidase M14 [Gammaproteobacteria bacterium]|nr:peptidase M14 [Gammaproteobacteria bacterium]
MSDIPDQYNELPENFLNVKASELRQVLSRPSLIHLKGKKTRPLFICTLLHGNETTGFYALQKLLRDYQGMELPRSVSIFIGNVKAAEKGLRRLDEQVDYNRIWPGTAEHYLAEAHMMHQVTEIMREKKVWASIDIHNNTGKNPHYACINKMQNEFMSLATLFSEVLVYFTTPKGVQSAAFAEICPAVTLECGLSGDVHGTDHVLQYLQAVLLLDDLDKAIKTKKNIYHTVARVKIPEGYSFGFSDDATINLLPGIENYNFCELDAGVEMARVEPDSKAFLLAFDNDEREVGREFFDYQQNKILLKKAVMPAMLTMNTQIIRQDCLCYLMERISVASE